MDNWIKKYEEEEETYNKFYKSIVNKINTTTIFLNLNNEIVHIKKEKIDVDNNILKQEQILTYFIKNKRHHKIRYKLISLMSYLINLNKEDINDYIVKEDQTQFLKHYANIENIIVPETIQYFHDVNEIIFILKEKNKNTTNLNTTKKIRFKINNKTNNKINKANNKVTKSN